MPEMQVRKLQEWERLHLFHCTGCSLSIHEIIIKEPYEESRPAKPEDIEC